MKNYHSEDNHLFFVPISWKKQASDHKIPSVPHKEHIKVVPVKQFVKLSKNNDKNRALFIISINKVFEIKKIRDIKELK